tara:strand:+ start:609 stop:914 length:306 start_codon:yes stop_codon:yes gene_type:complete
MKTFILTIILCLFASVCYSGTWVPYGATPVLRPPVIEVPAVPSVTYSTYPQWPVLIYPRYDWVPYYVNNLVVTERFGFFGRRRSYHYEPKVEWVLQPVYNR